MKAIRMQTQAKGNHKAAATKLIAETYGILKAYN